MALTLNSGRQAEDSPTLQLRMPQANVAPQPLAEPELPPVVLCVPEVGAKSSIKPARKTDLDGSDAVEAADAQRSEAPPAGPSLVSQLAEKWQSIDWAKVGAWASRPTVAYSLAAVVAVILIAAIAARSPSPAASETPAGEMVAEDISPAQPDEQHLSEHTGKTEMPLEKQQQDPITPAAPTRPNPSDEIVKLPPVVGPNSSVLPWRKEASTDFSPRQELLTNGAAQNFAPHTDSNERSSERPNVARLEGRIHTPKLPR